MMWNYFDDFRERLAGASRARWPHLHAGARRGLPEPADHLRAPPRQGRRRPCRCGRRSRPSSGATRWTTRATARAPSYDYRALKHLVDELHRWDARWEDWFHATGREPIRVIYEEFAGTRAATIGRVLDALGIDPPEPDGDRPDEAPGRRPLAGLGLALPRRRREPPRPHLSASTSIPTACRVATRTGSRRRRSQLGDPAGRRQAEVASERGGPVLGAQHAALPGGPRSRRSARDARTSRARSGSWIVGRPTRSCCSHRGSTPARMTCLAGGGLIPLHRGTNGWAVGEGRAVRGAGRRHRRSGRRRGAAGPEPPRRRDRRVAPDHRRSQPEPVNPFGPPGEELVGQLVRLP